MAETPQRYFVIAAVTVAVLLIGWRHQQSGAAAAPPAPVPVAAAGSVATESPVVVVYVTGAVRRPGVYRLRNGARVQEAVRRAAPRPGANLAGLNLAARLADGEQVTVPGPGQAGAAAAAPGGSPGAPVHLNSATLEQLQELDGIGPALAQRILDYRAAHGGFRSLEELDQVSGFGPARLAALQGRVAL
jgi:competence protein ComEA